MSDSRPSHVFLSYSEENEPFVESLALRLRDDTHLTFWFRPWHAVPGKDLQAQMEQALGDAQACAVFLGTARLEDLQNGQMRDILEGLMEDKTRGGTRSYHVFIDSGEIRGWQNEQMRAAIQSHVEDDPAYRVIPVLLPGTARPDKRDLPRFLRLYEPVEFRSPDDERAFRYLLAGILGIPPIEVEGFLEAWAEAVPHEIVETTIEEEFPLPEPAFEPLHVDPDDPPLQAIRDLLLAAFQPTELRTFCQDRRQFRDIVYRFSPGHGLIQMVGEVIDYCGMRNLWDELLEAVAQDNPRQYARFEPQLRSRQPPG